MLGFWPGIWSRAFDDAGVEARVGQQVVQYAAADGADQVDGVSAMTLSAWVSRSRAVFRVMVKLLRSGSMRDRRP
jgi:hypothetical protein